MNATGSPPLAAQRLLHILFFGAMALAGCWVLFGSGIYMAGVSVLLCLICWRVKISRFGLALFAAALLARVAVILVLHPPVISDFAVIYNASLAVREGSYDWQYSSYFQTWPGQAGQAVFQGLLLKLWNSPACIKLVNCLAGAGTAVLVYQTARRFFAEAAARAAGALYAFSLLPLAMCSVLSNHPASTFFTCLAVYLLASTGACTPPPRVTQAFLGLSGAFTGLSAVSMGRVLRSSGQCHPS